MRNQVVSREESLKTRLELLPAEKEFTRQRDALTRRRMAMPWKRVEKSYQFEAPNGALSLADLFDGRSQLIVYHFMFGTDWEEGCKSCSFWADNFNGIPIHINHRGVTFTAVSRAPLAKINAYKKRMGWSFPWVSSYGSDFKFDYHVWFTPEQIAEGKAYYNYQVRPNTLSDEVGSSVFYKNERGEVFQTDSCYSRGVDMFNGAYHTSILCPKAAMRTASNSRWSGYAGTISIEALRRRISTSPRSTGTKKMFEDSRGSVTMIAIRRETAGRLCRTRQCGRLWGRLAMPRGRADLRNHGAACFSWRPAGCALLGHAGCVTAERNGPDVLADERLPFGALAEADLHAPKRYTPVVIRCSS